MNSDTPLTMACWRDGKWHADELANLTSKLEHDLAQARAELELVKKQRDEAVGVIQKAYRKHYLNDESIGRTELGDRLCDTLYNQMGYDAFTQWIKDDKTPARSAEGARG